MNILVISPGYPTSKTIDFIFVDQLCRAFADGMHTINVIAPQSLTKSIIRRVPIVKKISLIRTINGNNIYVHRPLYLTFGNSKLSRSLNNVNFNNAVERSFKKLKDKPDVCYGHFWGSAISIFRLAKKFDIPLVVSSGEEEITIQETHSSKLFKEFINYITCIISVSSKNKSEIISAKLADEDKCMVIPNAVDSKLFYKKEKSKSRELLKFPLNDFIVVFVGQFNERKGILRLDQALQELKDTSIKAIFIGSGPQIPNYENIIHMGMVQHQNLPDYLNCADVFVLPTLNEGCSNSIVEAMACGIPIISSDRSFNHDILDAKNSLLIDPTNISEIADAIYSIKTDSKLQTLLSKNALLTSSKLSIEKRAEKIIRYIQQEIGTKIEK